jgi:uncharacterized membrane protein
VSARRASRDRGAVIPIVALSLGVLLIMTAFSLDLGRLSLRRREMQSVADIASLDLVRHLDGRTVNQINSDPSWSAAIDGTQARNGLSPGGTHTFVVDLGHWDGTSFTVFTGDQIPDAVRVEAGDHVDYFFVPGGGDTSRIAVSTHDAEGGAGVSRIASPGEILTDTFQHDLLDATLTLALAGSPVAIPAAGYDELASSSVSLRDLALTMGFATPETLVGTTVSARDMYAGAAALATAQGEVDAASALSTLSAAVDPDLTLDLTRLVIASGGLDGNAEFGALNLLALATGIAFDVADGATFTLPPLAVDIPGVTSVAVTLRIRPGSRWVFGGIGTALDTSFIQVAMVPTIDLPDIDIGIPDLAEISGTVSATVRSQPQHAVLSQVYCPGNSFAQPQGLDLTTTTQPARLDTQTHLVVQAPASGTPVLLANLDQSKSDLAVTQAGGTVPFDWTAGFAVPFGSGSPVSIGPAPLGLNTAMHLGPSTASFTADDGSVNHGTMLAAINDALDPIRDALDNLITTRFADALGADVTGPSVAALSMDCTDAKLAA